MPWSVAAFSPDSFLVVYPEADSTFSLSVLDSGGHHSRRVTVNDPLRVLFAAGTLLGQSRKAVVANALVPDRWVRIVDTEEQDDDHQLVTAVAYGLTLWFVSLSNKDTTLAAVRIQPDLRAAPLRSWPLHTLGHLAGLSETQVALAEAKPPHRIFVFELKRDTSTTIDVTAPDPPYNARSVRTMGLVALDCGFALLTLADLRSARRWLVLLDLLNNRLVRIATVDEPMGVYQAAPQGRLLYGFSDQPGARRLVVWRWSWLSPPL